MVFWKILEISLAVLLPNTSAGHVFTYTNLLISTDGKFNILEEYIKGFSETWWKEKDMNRV